ncbi:hypothetical protein Riv7116_1232 [Rivularia sp. PCC 7116]|uniref:hypothetical protein n=1 Tax=Rivularia sp. PCC 7116 TaxID=373994 RepID=UPI00029EC765|nr:hypothetical protein [Rivularia sp. PCC 7116]AFY53801.1 hypothetical protein Riv7116_1232 [Rivularia sp. PCC 7116]
MNDWKYFFDYELNNPEQINYRIFAPDYKAAILYWFSREDIPKQQKEDLIRVLVNFDDDCGDFYRYRAYFLAAEALNYFPEFSFGDAIVKQLLDWSYLYFGWQLFPHPLVETARKALQVTDKTRVIGAFEKLLRNTPSRLTLQSAAVKLGELDAGNKMAIAALILLLDVTTDNYRLLSICKSISKIAAGSQAAINTVVKLMQTTEDKNLCCEAIKTLGKIGWGNQIATLALEKFLQINRGDRICFDAAKNLLLIDSGNEVAKDALVYLLESTQELYLLIKTVEFLQEIDSQNQAAIKVLSERLKTCRDDVLRAEIAASLGKFDCNQAGVKEALIGILESYENVFLDDLDSLEICGDNELYLHRRIITSLVQLYPSDKDVISSLFSFIERNLNIDIDVCLSITPDVRTSSLAIYALRNIFFDGHVDLVVYQKVIAIFVRFLKKNRSSDLCIQIAVAEAILQLEPDNEIAVSILVEIMETHQNIWIGEKAATILLQLESHYQQAMSILIKLHSKENIGVLLGYKRLLPDNYLDKIVKEDKTTRVLIDEAIALGIQNLLDAIAKDKKLPLDHEYKTSRYMTSEEERFFQVWSNVNSITKQVYFSEIITALKAYLSEKFYYSNSSRYDEVYQFMWDCAEKMSYQDFYKAWNS